MITKFAEQHRLKVTKDICDEVIIKGRIHDSHIYEYSDDEFGVMFITNGKQAPRTGLFNKFKADCLSVGMTLRQLGDAEGAFSFNPSDSKQAKVAINGIKARVKRTLSPEHAAAGAARLAIARQSRGRVNVNA